MISAFAIAKPLLIKFGIPALAIIVAYGGYKGWEAYQQYQGRAEEQERQRVELMRQAVQSADSTAKQLQIKSAQVDGLVRTNYTIQQRLHKVQKEIAHHDSTEKSDTPIHPDAVRIVDELAGVLNSKASTERMPTSSETTGQPIVEGDGAVATIALVKRVNELTRRIAIIDARDKALSDYSVAQYQEALKFCLAQFEDPDEGHRYCIGHEAYHHEENHGDKQP